MLLFKTAVQRVTQESQDEDPAPCWFCRTAVQSQLHGASTCGALLVPMPGSPKRAEGSLPIQTR